MKRNLLSLILTSVLTVSVTSWMLLSVSEAGAEVDVHEEEPAKGLHGGRLLTKGDFSLELTVYETGLPPEFRVYAYHDKEPIDPDTVDLAVTLKRLGNKMDNIKFSPQQDYLRGNTVIYEPHSFEVIVKATHEEMAYTWEFENFEGRTNISEEIAREMSIQTEAVGPLALVETRVLTGHVQTNPNRLSRVRARFQGIVKKIHFELGDTVRAGDILATVQSNESLQNYQIKAPIKGLIVKRDIQIGEATGDNPLFIIVDNSDVWVELDVFAKDLGMIKKGQSVVIENLDGDFQKTVSIDWVSPLTAHASQSVRARAIIPNEDGALRPGQFIRGLVTVAEHNVALAVRQSALQRFRDFKVVFAHIGDNYEVRMLELGRSNHDWVEVLSGIEPGIQYVTENSYLIKADIEKSGASHDH